MNEERKKKIWEQFEKGEISETERDDLLYGIECENEYEQEQARELKQAMKDEMRKQGLLDEKGERYD